MINPLIAHYRGMARYNRLANERLYEACAGLSDGERKKPRPAFFKSIHGTLNHIMVGDRIWLGRFEGREMPSTDLDRILYRDFEDLRRAREREDARIETFADGLTDDVLNRSLRYVNNAGNVHSDPLSLLITHFFNHQTHHRGQIHDMLTQTDRPPPSMDLHRLLRPVPLSRG